MALSTLNSVQAPFCSLIAAMVLAGCATAYVQTNVDKTVARPLKKTLIVVTRDAIRETSETLAIKDPFVQQFVAALQAASIRTNTITVTLPELDPGKSLRTAVATLHPSEILYIAQEGYRRSQYSVDGIHVALTESSIESGREIWKALAYLPARSPEQTTQAVKDLADKMTADGILKPLCNGS